MYKEYDIVKLIKTIPGKEVSENDKGIIVMIHKENNLPLAYEVEFFNKAGNTIAVLTVLENQLEPYE